MAPALIIGHPVTLGIFVSPVNGISKGHTSKLVSDINQEQTAKPFIQTDMFRVFLSFTRPGPLEPLCSEEDLGKNLVCKRAAKNSVYEIKKGQCT